MNIFVLSRDPQEAGRFHCNKHVVKMILESAQMLCAAHWTHLLADHNLSLSDFKRVRDAQQWLFDNTDKSLQPPWKLSHTRHPCTLWTAENVSNYMWHSRLGYSLLHEYTRRYDKIHKSQVVHEWLRKNLPINISSGSITEHPVCMPDDCKISGSVVESYRNYYKKYKNKMAVWEPRSVTPVWYKEQ